MSFFAKNVFCNVILAQIIWCFAGITLSLQSEFYFKTIGSHEKSDFNGLDGVCLSDSLGSGEFLYSEDSQRKEGCGA